MNVPILFFGRTFFKEHREREQGKITEVRESGRIKGTSIEMKEKKNTKGQVRPRREKIGKVSKLRAGERWGKWRREERKEKRGRGKE